MACSPFLHICIEIVESLLCFAGQNAPGALGLQVAVSPNGGSLLFALVLGKFWMYSLA
jgi:hypothetical protein